MTHLQQAFRLYKSYKTSTPEYKALAAHLGYASTGDLNRHFHCRINKLGPDLHRVKG
jgi:hypothetical protein